MDTYVVDTNLLYSSILKPGNKIAKFIVESANYNVKLLSPQYMQAEILKYSKDIQETSGYSDADFEIVKRQFFGSIKFIDDDIIPFQEWIKALRIVRDIDVNDVSFVALNDYLDKVLWTGDKRLFTRD